MQVNCIIRLLREYSSISRRLLDFGIKFEKEDKLVLHGFANRDWVGSCDDMRSTSGYLFSLGSGCLVFDQVVSVGIQRSKKL